ncbi:beta-glucuronosyltransferase GlcAT14A-like [Carex rostrata]
MLQLLRKNSPILTIIVIISGAVFFSYSLMSSYITIWPQIYSVRTNKNISTLKVGPEYPPSFAYIISGTGGENKRIIRLLQSVYHPRNYYLLQLDSGSTEEERIELGKYVKNEQIFRTYGNVFVLGKANAVEWSGSSMVATTLHGAAVLLKLCKNWDWFINLSSLDYPLVTQDDLLDAFMSVPRDLNFIDHTSQLDWKEDARFNKILVDPSIYSRKSTKYFISTATRKTPNAFKLFTGSPWVILSRSFVEDCILGTDNLPRRLLMYFTNVVYSMEAYFQTVSCNLPDFMNKTINADLRFFLWGNPPGLDPLFLKGSNFDKMISSGAAFARRFVENEPVLDRLDKEILRRSSGNFTYGKWLEHGDINNVASGSMGLKLRQLILGVIRRRSCI